jgi:hypothetical protein
MAKDQSPAPATLFDLSASHRISALVYVAAQLGIADLIGEAAMSAAELAKRTDTDERSLNRLMRGLVTIGVCRQSGENFAVTEIGAHLAENANPSLKAFVLFEGSMLRQSWHGLLESIRTAKTEAELAGDRDFFERMSSDRDHVRIFNDAMVSLTRMVMPAVLAAYDFSGIARLFDVGGGFGELLIAILKAHPKMRGAVFDLPRCEEGARQQFARAGLVERAEFIAGDFFEAIPRGADAIVMKSIIHDWDDARSNEILGNCRKALPADGRVLLVERVMPGEASDGVDDRASVLSDLNMLRVTGGAERTESEYRDLLGANGFSTTRVFPAGRFAIVEGKA